MMNNIILNGVNSNTIQGLIIQELPPISKPAIRTEIEEIDGRDGDVITKLGYAAYDKQLSIGLYGNYDINQVISFFNTSGTVIFSNEPDKYYNYQILNEIDFERLVRFRTAIVTMHVQPFKYSATETPQELSGTVVTGEGSNINLKNTTDSGLFTDLQKKGDTFQQTYTGKNLLNSSTIQQTTKNGVTCTYNSTTQEITFNGTCTTDNTTFGFSNVVINTTTNLTRMSVYYVSGSVSGTATCNIRMLGSDWTGTQLSLLTLSSSNPILYATANRSFESIHNDFRINNGVVLNNLKFKVMIADDLDTTYEPYVGGSPSPNPDYPQEVKTVTGNNNVTICGKQLFDKNNANKLNSTLNSSGISTSQNAWLLYIPIIGGKTYTVSKVISARFNLCTTVDVPQNGVIISNYTSVPTYDSYTLTTPSTANYLVVYYFLNGTDTLTEQQILDSIQIEEGTEATPYEAYTSQTYPINLGNIELCSINGAEDYIYKNNGTWYKHSVIGKVVLNGIESWSRASNGNNNTYRFYITRPTNSMKNTINLYSNYFTPNNDYTGTDNIIFFGATSILISRVKTNNNYIETVSNFKTWLSTHNTDVYYVLATPTDTEITDSTLLSQLNALGNATTYLGATNISTSGDGLSPILYVETVAVDDPVLKITNSGNTTAKPIMTLYGTGTINLSLNGEQIFVIDLSSENYITIDVANMEAYYNGILKNRLVTGNYENFVLNQGENEITFTGTLYSLTISNYSRWI